MTRLISCKSIQSALIAVHDKVNTIPIIINPSKGYEGLIVVDNPQPIIGMTIAGDIDYEYRWITMKMILDDELLIIPNNC